jgi:hypothetical protein
VCFLRSTEGGFEFVLPVGVFTLNFDAVRLKDTSTLLTNSLIFIFFAMSVKYYAMVGFRTAMANLFF